MGRIFSLDSPLIQFMNKVADLIWLNILTVICCIPIITIGPSLTAAHYVALKMRRNGDGYVTRNFFKAFKENFKQATIIWLIALFIFFLLITDLYVLYINGNPAEWMRILVLAVGVVVIFTLVWVFPIQAKFSNTIGATLKNAFAMSIWQMPKTVFMIIFYAAPIVLICTREEAFPFFLMFCASLPIFGSAVLYNKTFQKLEDQIAAKLAEEAGAEGDSEGMEAGEDERIFIDASAEEEK